MLTPQATDGLAEPQEGEDEDERQRGDEKLSKPGLVEKRPEQEQTKKAGEGDQKESRIAPAILQMIKQAGPKGAHMRCVNLCFDAESLRPRLGARRWHCAPGHLPRSAGC